MWFLSQTTRYLPRSDEQYLRKRNNANNLRNIKVEEMWWETLQLDHEIKQKFEQYCDFSVEFV
ncbi:hypothetical protein Hdeb2414_s0012g00381111 [Helianthus debilis subsp. tardiflorus]